MIQVGQISLLLAFVAAGYAAYGAFRASRSGHGSGLRRPVVSAVVCVLALTAVLIVLAWALWVKDFRFAYVAEYSARQLAWQYSLSALWVGQEGSLLLWTWLLGLVALAFVRHTRHQARALRARALGLLMLYVFFLTALLVFAADPVQPSLTARAEGNGLSPLLMHPAMLIHPPVVFLGYAAWAVPCALALAALGDRQGEMPAAWLDTARTWTVVAWVVLGSGIILGGNWAYEELGWGGYWAWDPVENGSLLPWLAGTALLHCLLAWRYRGVLKRTTLALAVATFTLCNFATFLTRSGVFSSLHAFSRSPIGWTFLGMMVLLGVGLVIALWVQRGRWAPDRAMRSLWSRESLIATGSLGLLLLSVVTFVGTLMVPLSDLVLGRKIVVGAAFFNNATLPIGLLLLSLSAATPLLRWGVAPARIARRLLAASAAGGTLTAFVGWWAGERQSVVLVVVGCAGFAGAVCLSALWLDVRASAAHGVGGVLGRLSAARPRYASYLMHLAFTCLAVGIAGSSLGSSRAQVTLREGESRAWAGGVVRLAALREYSEGDTIIADVQLDLSRGAQHLCTLFPARHFHSLQQEWTTEVAIHSTWLRDYYTILHGAAGVRQADLTLVVNPLVRWIWLGGWLFVIGSVVRLWPARVVAGAGRPVAGHIARPKFLARVRGARRQVRRSW